MYHSSFIHSSDDGHLGCFHLLAIVNRAAMNFGLHVSFSVLVSSGYMLSSGIAGSYGSFTVNGFLKRNHWGQKEVAWEKSAKRTVNSESHQSVESVSHSVVSDSLWPPWTVAHQAPLSMGILQARILEWVAIPFSRESSQPRDQMFCISGRFFTVWATRYPIPRGNTLWGENKEDSNILRLKKTKTTSYQQNHHKGMAKGSF